MGCSWLTRLLFGAVLASAIFLVIIPMTILSFNDCNGCQMPRNLPGLRLSDQYNFQLDSNTTTQLSSVVIPPTNEDEQSKAHYTGNKRFIYHPGKVSVGGDCNRQVPLQFIGNIEHLKSQCDLTPECVGFTTDGVLKRIINPFNRWTNVSDNEKNRETAAAGLYTIDINYCESSEYHSCPKGTKCVNTMNGTYSCQQQYDIATKDSVIVANKNEVQLVVSVDTALLPGLLALLQSIKVNSKKDTNIAIHVLVSVVDRQHVEDEVLCTVKMPPNIKVSYKTFDVPDSFKQLIRVESHTYLKSTANFARFFFADVFPSLSHVLYLDADTIVLHNIHELWTQVIETNDKLLVAVRRQFPRYKIHFPYGNLTSLYFERYNQTLDMFSPTFNAGVLGFNLNKWRENKVTEEVLYWMKENTITPLWFQGTQPILYIIAFNDWKAIDERWNVEGLGWTRVSAEAVRKANILHWNGPDKPWGKMDTKNIEKKSFRKLTGQYNVKWRKYKKEKCSGKGVCLQHSVKDNQTSTIPSSGCVCNHGYEGDLCEKRQ